MTPPSDRERAREIVEDQVSMTGYVGSKSWLIDRIAAALAAVREEALEEAAKLLQALLTAARDEVRTGHAQGALVQAVQAIENNG